MARYDLRFSFEHEHLHHEHKYVFSNIHANK